MCESVRIAQERIAEYMQHHAIITVHKDNTPSVIHATLHTPTLLKLVNRSRQKDNIISRIPLQLLDTVLLRRHRSISGQVPVMLQFAIRARRQLEIARNTSRSDRPCMTIWELQKLYENNSLTRNSGRKVQTRQTVLEAGTHVPQGRSKKGYLVPLCRLVQCSAYLQWS